MSRERCLLVPGQARTWGKRGSERNSPWLKCDETVGSFVCPVGDPRLCSGITAPSRSPLGSTPGRFSSPRRTVGGEPTRVLRLLRLCDMRCARYLLLPFRHDWNAIEMAIGGVGDMKKVQPLRLDNPHVHLGVGNKITQGIEIPFQAFRARSTMTKSSAALLVCRVSRRRPSTVP